MSTRALSCVDAWIIALQRATRNVDLLTEKNCSRRAKIASCEQGRRSFDEADERCRRQAACSVGVAGTKTASIHYATGAQKDLAGASIEFDVRQTRINDAT
ncbi:hypothetical protein RAD15_16075 [Bradyrhizobium sp. 14AA]